MINVILHGSMAAKFRGNQPDGSWLLDVQSPREAIHAIERNVGGMFQYLIKKTEEGVEYRVVIDGKDFEHIDELYIPMGDYDTIEFVPVILGESTGLWQIIAGVLLIIVGVVIGVATSWTGIGLVIGGALVSAGIGLVIGGITNLLLPAQTNGAKNQPSYLFSGQINSTRQGEAVPVPYGIGIWGSQLISAYLTTAEIDQKGHIISQIPTDPNLPPPEVNPAGGPFGGPGRFERVSRILGDDQFLGLGGRLLEGRNEAVANDPDMIRKPTVISPFTPEQQQ